MFPNAAKFDKNIYILPNLDTFYLICKSLQNVAKFVDNEQHFIKSTTFTQY